MTKSEPVRSTNASAAEVGRGHRRILEALSGQPFVHFHPVMVDVAGSLPGGIMLGKAVYWTMNENAEEDVWICKSREEWERDTSIGRSGQETGRSGLRKTTFYFEKRYGVPGRIHFKLDLDELEKKVGAALEARRVRRKAQGGNPSLWTGRKAAEHNAGKPPEQSGETARDMAAFPPCKSLQITETSTESTSSSETAPPELTLRLQSLLVIVDDDGVAKLWKECRSRAPNCTPEEVLYFVRDKLAGSSNGRIQNPMGFLLTAVPKCFEGQSFAAFREQQKRKSPTSKANGGDATNPFSRENLQNYITATASQVRKSAANHPSGKKRLLQVVRALEGIELPAAPDVEFVERQMISIDDKLHGVLVDLAGAELLELLRRKIEKETARPYKEEMSAANLADMQTRCLRPRIFKEFGMPRLTLLDVRPPGKGKPAKGEHAERHYADSVESGYLWGEQP